MDGTFPSRVGQVSSTRPFPQTNHRHLQRREHSSASQYYMRYLFLVATSLFRLCLSVSFCSPCSIFDRLSATKVPAPQAGLGGRERASRSEQSSRAQGCARPAPGHCLILGWRRMPFLPQTLNINQNRTVPHRIARHRTVPHLVLPSGPSTGRPVSLLLCPAASISGVLSSIPQRLTQRSSLSAPAKPLHQPVLLLLLPIPRCQDPLRCLIPSLPFSH